MRVRAVVGIAMVVEVGTAGAVAVAVVDVVDVAVLVDVAGVEVVVGVARVGVLLVARLLRCAWSVLLVRSLWLLW